MAQLSQKIHSIPFSMSIKTLASAKVKAMTFNTTLMLGKEDMIIVNRFKEVISSS